MRNLHIPLQPRKLSSNEKGQLVDKLLDCPQMKDRHTRDTIVQELSFAGSIPRHQVDRNDVWDVVNASLNYEGGLRELVEVVGAFEKDEFDRDSLPMQRLSELLEILFSLPEAIAINVDLLRRLYKLTTDVHVVKNKLHNMYRRSVVDGLLPSKYQSMDESETLPLMIRDLAQKGQQSTPQNKLTHSLLIFVKLLSQEVAEPIRGQLMQWREELAAKEGILLEEESSADTEAEQVSENAYYLLVKFKPGNNRDVFELHAWLICEQNGKTLPVDSYVKEEAVLEEIPSLFDELISQCQEHTDTFTIELFLPFALLNRDKDDVHKWKLDLGFDNTIAVSYKYPLVVRSYDRVYAVNKMRPEVRRRLRQAWEDNWAICKKCGEAKIQWSLKEKDYAKENLVAWLQGVACLTMMFVPPAFDANAAQIHIFKKMLSAGSSVALWPRPHHKCLNEEVIEQAYHSLLAGCYFSKLPRMIWERRKEASMDETSLANHLTLFWDNPYRLPSDAPDAPVRDKYLLVAPR